MAFGLLRYSFGTLVGFITCGLLTLVDDPYLLEGPPFSGDLPNPNPLSSINDFFYWLKSVAAPPNFPCSSWIQVKMS